MNMNLAQLIAFKNIIDAGGMGILDWSHRAQLSRGTGFVAEGSAAVIASAEARTRPILEALGVKVRVVEPDFAKEAP